MDQNQRRRAKLRRRSRRLTRGIRRTFGRSEPASPGYDPGSLSALFISVGFLFFAIGSLYWFVQGFVAYQATRQIGYQLVLGTVGSVGFATVMLVAILELLWWVGTHLEVTMRWITDRFSFWRWLDVQAERGWFLGVLRVMSVLLLLLFAGIVAGAGIGLYQATGEQRITMVAFLVAPIALMLDLVRRSLDKKFPKVKQDHHV